MKVPSHISDEINDILKGNMGNYIVLPLIVVFLRMTYGLLREKESKIKEDLKIMGMSDSSFYLSWIIHYEIIYLIISLFASAFLKISMDLNVFFFYKFNRPHMKLYYFATSFIAGV